MKSRDRQQNNRRIKEKMLDLRNMYGAEDPTPYKAVKEIIKEFKRGNEKKNSNISLHKRKQTEA